MMLELAVTSEAEAADDAHDGSGVGAQALGHGAHAQQDVFARLLQDGADNLLAFCAESFDAFRKVDRRPRSGKRRFFHAARELLKFISMSTRDEVFTGTDEANSVISPTPPLSCSWPAPAQRPVEGRASWLGAWDPAARWDGFARGDEWPGSWGSLLRFPRSISCEAAITNLRKDFAHFLAGFGSNDSRARGVVALLGGVADGIAHVAEAAAVNEVNDQL